MSRVTFDFDLEQDIVFIFMALKRKRLLFVISDRDVISGLKC